MIGPIPTMIRKPKSGISTGGLSSGGKVSSQISLAVQLPEAMKLPSLGISIAKRFRSLTSSGIASRWLDCRPQLGLQLNSAGADLPQLFFIVNSKK